MEDDDQTDPRALNFSEQVVLLREKSSKTREASLEAILKELLPNSHLYYDDIVNNLFTLEEYIKRNLKKGSTKERELICLLSCVMFLTLGDEAEAFWKNLSPLLQVEISGGRVLALNPFAIGCFTISDEADSANSIAFLSSQFETAKEDPQFVTRLIEAWNFLLTTMPTTYVCQSIIPKHAEELLEMLKDEKRGLDVQTAVGQSFALFYTLQSAHNEEFELDQWDELLDVDTLREQMEYLSSYSGREVSKKSRSSFKASFRHYRDTLLDGYEPSESLVISRTQIHFSGHKRLIQLNFFRELLTTSFDRQLSNNQLLQQIFGVSIDPNRKKEKLTKVDKRLTKSKNSQESKDKTQQRQKQRKMRGNKNGTFYAEGEE